METSARTNNSRTKTSYEATGTISIKTSDKSGDKKSYQSFQTKKKTKISGW
jgi:hypothetical protein